MSSGVNVTASAVRHAWGSKWIEGSERILSAPRRTCAARVGWPADTSPGQPTQPLGTDPKPCCGGESAPLLQSLPATKNVPEVADA
jgi:hypothetical protein